MTLRRKLAEPVVAVRIARGSQTPAERDWIIAGCAETFYGLG